MKTFAGGTVSVPSPGPPRQASQMETGVASEALSAHWRDLVALNPSGDLSPPEGMHLRPRDIPVPVPDVLLPRCVQVARLKAQIDRQRPHAQSAPVNTGSAPYSAPLGPCSAAEASGHQESLRVVGVPAVSAGGEGLGDASPSFGTVCALLGSGGSDGQASPSAALKRKQMDALTGLAREAKREEQEAQYERIRESGKITRKKTRASSSMKRFRTSRFPKPRRRLSTRRVTARESLCGTGTPKPSIAWRRPVKTG